MKHLLALTVLFCAIQLPVHATGILLPKDQSLPALAIKHQRINIDIKDGVATAKIEQVFKSNVDRVLEATYIFPLPEGATVAEFAMYINGKRQTGELVEAQKAREIYEGIVRRMRDPGLLEYMDTQLLKMRVYPIPAQGEQRIEVSYSQQLDYEGGTYKLVYPLHTTKAASRTLEDFTLGATISSKTPIKTIYSPSHEVGISRKGKHEAVVGFEQYQSLLDKDFVLYYGVSEKRFGLNLLTHATKGEDGYFMMMIAPEYDKKDLEIVERDIVFVFDTSGSMAGEKMTQARDALAYCAGKLNKGDRFNIVRFSTDVDTFKDELVQVDDDSRKDALEYIDALKARGGTDIDSALTTALKMRTDAKRPFTVVFLTDGKPTIGETDPEIIVKHISAKNESRTRVFVFGVGEKVNTILLDRVSGETGGHSQYVRPNEDIETVVSAFYDKASQPVLSVPELAIKGLKTYDLYPRELDDMFHGNQLTVLGRYKGEGDHAVILKGEINGDDREYVYEHTFEEDQIDNDFISRLWATRKIGFLLDEIRLKGEIAELKDEVIQLSKEFGIMTPYTSLLVLETDKDYAQHNIPRDQQARIGDRDRRQEEADRRREKAQAERAAQAWVNGPSAAVANPADDQELKETFGHEIAKSRGKGGGRAFFRHAGNEARKDNLGFSRKRGAKQAYGDAPSQSRERFEFDGDFDDDGFRDGSTIAVVPDYGGYAATRDGLEDLSTASRPALDIVLPLSSQPAPVLRVASKGQALQKLDGKVALDMSEAIADYKYAEAEADEGNEIGATRWIGKKLFTFINGVWIDSDFKKEMTLKKITYLSDEYFALLKDDDLVKQYLALGERVIFVVDEKTAISIVE